MLNYVLAPGRNLIRFITTEADHQLQFGRQQVCWQFQLQQLQRSAPLTGNSISFAAPFAMTRMACPGDGENLP
jgi:hypothetical protein